MFRREARRAGTTDARRPAAVAPMTLTNLAGTSAQLTGIATWYTQFRNHQSQGTRDVTLYPFWGVARLTRLSDRPWQEIYIAATGPVRIRNKASVAAANCKDGSTPNASNHGEW